MLAHGATLHTAGPVDRQSNGPRVQGFHRKNTRDRRPQPHTSAGCELACQQLGVLDTGGAVRATFRDLPQQHGGFVTLSSFLCYCRFPAVAEVHFISFRDSGGSLGGGGEACGGTAGTSKRRRLLSLSEAPEPGADNGWNLGAKWWKGACGSDRRRRSGAVSLGAIRRQRRLQSAREMEEHAKTSGKSRFCAFFSLQRGVDPLIMQ